MSSPALQCRREFFEMNKYEILDTVRSLGGGHIGDGVLFFPTEDVKMFFILKFQG